MQIRDFSGLRDERCGPPVCCEPVSSSEVLTDTGEGAHAASGGCTAKIQPDRPFDLCRAPDKDQQQSDCVHLLTLKTDIVIGDTLTPVYVT